MNELLERGKILNKEWNDGDIKFIERINECIKIENNVNYIMEINEKNRKINTKK